MTSCAGTSNDSCGSDNKRLPKSAAQIQSTPIVANVLPKTSVSCVPWHSLQSATVSYDIVLAIWHPCSVVRGISQLLPAAKSRLVQKRLWFVEMSVAGL